jgi:predicted RecA/RadA family phage recombinase
MVLRRKSASMLVWRRWIIAVWRNHPVSNHPDIEPARKGFFYICNMAPAGAIRRAHEELRTGWSHHRFGKLGFGGDRSGTPVAVGDVLAIAIADIAVGETGTGFTSGVVQLPKLAADDIAQGKTVYFKSGKVQLEATGATPAGKAWQAAGANVPPYWLSSMANPFDAMVARMDAATVNLMADKVTINGVSFDAVESQLSQKWGRWWGWPVTGGVLPGSVAAQRRCHSLEGKDYIVTRKQLFNGKPQIWIE